MKLAIDYLGHYDKAKWGPLKYAHAGDSGFDLRAAIEKSVVMIPGQVQKIPTGVVMHIPEGYEIQIRPRSGLASRGITVVNAPGTVDAGYRGEVSALLCMVAHTTMKIPPGERIAQAVLVPVTRAEIVDAADGDVAPACDNRGAGGFGHTGTT